MPDLLAEQTAIVTGASSGIGRSIARTFAEHGADVVVADVREEPREGGTPTHELITDETEATATYVDCDVSSVDDLEATLDEAEQFGGVDVLVNNAGIFHAEEFLEVAADQYEQLMSVNVRGAFFGTQLAAQRMIENGGGRVINVSSIAGLVGNGSYVAYCVSKGAVRLLTYATAHRLGPDGIRVNAIHPGGIETAMMEDAHMGPEALKQFTQAIPSRRIGDPEDIAGAALFLASDLSSYVNGESLVVDGGYTHTG
ncbi:short-chain dehydrogenase/reductase SDR (plasmid) [Haloterrigena turkmenica DSM 5511]|uniref:Short-chain dehydrogenase/reductase SDR n=1 Tax=Haloterrigena turkmenica (strain ATCC 51198 / DSM 5511 / JCM 9101 / NCIMB 13204 / VKM B-1734 / 4k) TaxID=543526 RepID=D2S0Z9_HALTV|nr:SDR family oxidoreductase [Haloterrigena turkmenica]ADB63046.1 short-chain dehydrogenase/reductase SDR [Haloterrigena turkmenica DSM 5511]